MSSDVFIVQPSEDEYLGLSNSNMEADFLVPNELRLNNDYWSDSVENLYRDAHPIDDKDQKEGVLLLDAVNPRVTTWGNTRDRAEKVKRKFPRFHCIVLSGTGGMQLSLAGEDKWIEKDELSTFVHDALAESQLDRQGRGSRRQGRWRGRGGKAGGRAGGGETGNPTWPRDTSELRVGVNDTWNAFQCANKGRSVSTAEWKAARAKLLARHNGGRGAAEEAAAEVESDLEEAAAEKIAELAEQIAEKDTLRIKFTVGDSFAPGTVVGVTPGEVLVDAQDEEFQVGNNN
jgi:hypothetical protein